MKSSSGRGVRVLRLAVARLRQHPGPAERQQGPVDVGEQQRAGNSHARTIADGTQRASAFQSGGRRTMRKNQRRIERLVRAAVRRAFGLEVQGLRRDEEELGVESRRRPVRRLH